MRSMRSNAGFAPVLVLLAIIAILAVAGGVAYMRYGRAPQGAAPSSASGTAAATSTPPSVSAVSGSSTAPAGSVESPAVAGPKDCGTDMSCFVAAAGTCAPATVEWVQSTVVFGVFDQEGQLHLSLGVPNAGSGCVFSDRTDKVTLSVTPQGGQWAKAQGATDAQVQQQLQAAQAQADRSAGASITCTLPTKTLVQMLTAWSEGSSTTSAFSANNCTAALPDGTKVPYSGSGQ